MAQMEILKITYVTNQTATKFGYVFILLLAYLFKALSLQTHHNLQPIQ
jgi:hypothetical protein